MKKKKSIHNHLLNNINHLHAFVIIIYYDINGNGADRVNFIKSMNHPVTKVVQFII